MLVSLELRLNFMYYKITINIQETLKLSLPAISQLRSSGFNQYAGVNITHRRYIYICFEASHKFVIYLFVHDKDINKTSRDV